MKFTLKKSSNWGFRDEIEINTLEELIKYQKELDKEIILGDYSEENELDNPYIEIYDDYRE